MGLPLVRVIVPQPLRNRPGFASLLIGPEEERELDHFQNLWLSAQQPLHCQATTVFAAAEIVRALTKSKMDQTKIRLSLFILLTK